MTQRSITGRIQAFLLLCCLIWAGLPALTTAQGHAIADVALGSLPVQVAQVYTAVHRGGPFSSEKDGSVFFNRERILPMKTRGYYREYTVPTPGVGHRGARRLVCGGPPRLPDACYYTGDHYESFRRVVP